MHFKGLSIVLTLSLVGSACTDLEGRVCASDDDCIDDYTCSSELICVQNGSLDAGGTIDAGGAEPEREPDAGVFDAGQIDAGQLDAGERDAGVDAGPLDAGGVDAGPLDAGVDAGVDAGFGDCGPGFFDQNTTGDAGVDCVPFTVCAAGSFVSSTGTPTEDQQCSPCTDGTFSTVEDASACDAWTLCLAGTEQTEAGTATASPTCVACPAGTFCAGDDVARQACASGQWDDDADAATACIAHTAACPPGTSFEGLGDATTDRRCPTCVGGFSTTTDSSCIPFSDCIVGEFISNAGTPTTDRTCATCVGSFSTEFNTVACQPFSTCTGPKTGLGGRPTHDHLCAETLLFGTTSSDELNAVAVDADGAVYVVGSTTDTGNGDRFARRYNPDGSFDWEYQQGNGFENQSSGIAVSASAVFFVGTNRSDVGNNDDMEWRIVDRQGNFGTLDRGQIKGAPEDDSFADVVADAAGNFYLVGTSNSVFVDPNPLTQERGFLFKYNPDGTDEVFREEISGGPEKVFFAEAAAAIDGIIVVGRSKVTPESSALVAKFDFDGGLDWNRTHEASDFVSAKDVVIAGNGDILVFGNTQGVFAGNTALGGTSDLFLMRINPTNGDLIDVFQFGSTGSDIANAMTIAPDGRIFAVARVDTALDGEEHFGAIDIGLFVFDDGGLPIATYQFGTSGDELGNDIAITETELVIVGRSDGDFGGTNSGSTDSFIQRIAIP